MNKNGIVDIFGGFGNQIFQFCFANSLKNKNLSITINTRDFQRVAKENSPLLTARKLVLPVEYFEFDEATSKEFRSYKLKKLIYESKFTKKLTNQNIYKSFNDKNYSDSEFKKFNRFTGNWQSLNVLIENKDFIKTSLSKNNILKDAIGSEVSSKETLLHVRRNDYIKFNEELNIEYYKKAFSIMKKKVTNFEYSVFTDDIDWVKKQKIFNDAKLIHTSSDKPLDVINTFSLMLKNYHFILANSTFSMLASFISQKTDSIIISPYPWFKKSNKDELIDNKWNLIDVSN
tara:strand:- start:2986 stop:3849 length:864 start_codon:yes stop_codon:yes gene_type:complete